MTLRMTLRSRVSFAHNKLTSVSFWQHFIQVLTPCYNNNNNRICNAPAASFTDPEARKDVIRLSWQTSTCFIVWPYSGQIVRSGLEMRGWTFCWYPQFLAETDSLDVKSCFVPCTVQTLYLPARICQSQPWNGDKKMCYYYVRQCCVWHVRCST